MAHTAESPYGKILEAIWYWIDNDSALASFLSDEYPSRTFEKYKLYDGTTPESGDVSSSETPCIITDMSGSDGQALSNIEYETGCIFQGASPSGTLSVELYGYMDTRSFDKINRFWELTLAALKNGIPTNFAVSSQGLLQGDDQLIQSVNFGRIIPGALWINPSDVVESRNRPLLLTFFAIQLELYLSEIS